MLLFVASQYDEEPKRNRERGAQAHRARRGRRAGQRPTTASAAFNSRNKNYAPFQPVWTARFAHQGKLIECTFSQMNKIIFAADLFALFEIKNVI